MASVKELLAEKRLKALDTPIKLPIPGWADGSLIGIFRPITDWATVREFMVTQDPEVEVQLALNSLVENCESTQAIVGEQVIDLPPLGIALLKQITDDTAETDSDALSLLIPTPEDTMDLYIALRDRSSARVKATEDELQGESPAS